LLFARCFFASLFAPAKKEEVIRALIIDCFTRRFAMMKMTYFSEADK